MVYQYRYIMTLVDVFAHALILRRKRRGIQPYRIQKEKSVRKILHNWELATGWNLKTG